MPRKAEDFVGVYGDSLSPYIRPVEPEFCWISFHLWILSHSLTHT